MKKSKWCEKWCLYTVLYISHKVSYYSTSILFWLQIVSGAEELTSFIIAASDLIVCIQIQK
jgi:hypothetical protein